MINDPVLGLCDLVDFSLSVVDDAASLSKFKSESVLSPTMTGITIVRCHHCQLPMKQETWRCIMASWRSRAAVVSSQWLYN